MRIERPSRTGGIIKLAASVLVCLAVGYIGSLATTPSIPTWYANLAKPAFNPPNAVFGPVWTLLFILMGISAYVVWAKGLAHRGVKTGLVLFIVQLALNLLWSVIFFALHQPLWAFCEIVLLWVAILLTIISFIRVSRFAGWLMIPYILWVSFASVLNFSVYLLNR